MKKLLVALALMGVLAGGAVAQTWEDWGIGGTMGMFFSDTDFTDANTNVDPALNTPFNGYVVILGCAYSSILGYEVGITVPATVLALSANGPNGWTNFGGSNFNHLCGFMTPLVMDGNGNAVLSTMQLMSLSPLVQEIGFGPAAPSSFADIAGGIAEGANPDNLDVCSLTAGDDETFIGVVATINGDGIVVPTENDTWTGVKDLFR
jgi:hypothetical protein